MNYVKSDFKRPLTSPRMVAIGFVFFCFRFCCACNLCCPMRLLACFKIQAFPIVLFFLNKKINLEVAQGNSILLLSPHSATESSLELSQNQSSREWDKKGGGSSKSQLL